MVRFADILRGNFEMNFGPVLTAVAVAFLAFAPAAEAQSKLATNASLSVEAIRLQSQSEKLLTLEQEQKAASKREADFAVQGAVIGAGVGAVGGAALACGLASLQGRKCDESVLIPGAVAGGVAGGVYGNQKGKDVAKRQNLAAKRENEMKRRLQIASKQLDTARTARKYAEAVAVQNQRKLARLKAEVKAGRAPKQALQIARADATADARQVKLAAAAIGGGANSLSNVNRQQGSAQSAAEAKNLANARASMTQEQAKTTAQYNALVKAINNSAL